MLPRYKGSGDLARRLRLLTNSKVRPSKRSPTTKMNVFLCLAVFVLALLGGNAQPMAPATAPSKTVTQTAQGVPDLSTLVAALTKAGLAGTLNDPNLVATVFAPTNAAFVALEKKLNYTADQLLNSSILKPTLLYHVVPNAAAQSSSLTNNEVLPTLLPGQNVTIFLTGGRVVVSGVQTAANVTQANVVADKAIVHIVDTVLLPAQSALAAAPAPAPGAASTTG